MLNFWGVHHTWAVLSDEQMRMFISLLHDEQRVAIKLRVEGCNQIHFEYKQCVDTVGMMQIYSVLRFKHRILHP